MSSEHVILPPGGGRKLDMGTFAMFVKAAGNDTDGAFSLLESSEPAGFGPPLHIHHDAAESFYVLEGEYAMLIDGSEYSCPVGSFVYVPAGVPHTFRVGIATSRKLNLYTPAAMIGYFDELSWATAEGTVDDERLAAIARTYSMQVLGPVPENYT